MKDILKEYLLQVLTFTMAALLVLALINMYDHKEISFGIVPPERSVLTIILAAILFFLPKMIRNYRNSKQ